MNANNPNPAAPYTSWATASATIPQAIDAAANGDLILVTNGVYDSGFHVVAVDVFAGMYMTNRVALNKAVTVQSVNGPGVTIIDGGGVTRCVYVRSNALLSGFTLTNGFGGNTYPQHGNGAYGGPAANSFGGIPFTSPMGTLSNCILVGNFGLTNAAGDLTVLGGGASQCVLKSCVLSNNSASYGGAASQCRLDSCWVVANFCSPGSAYVGGGGGLLLCVATNCLIEFNTNRASVGGTFVGGGASECLLYSCIVRSNAAYKGGGFSGTAINSLIYGNWANEYGAGGGDLTNCVVTQNAAANGFGGLTGGHAYNSIIYGNLGVDFNFFNSVADAHNCCLTDPYGYFTSITGGNNITNAPAFVDAAGGDFRLQSNSPCINAGLDGYALSGTDLAGNPRKVGIVDNGAYEFQTPTSTFPYFWLQQYGLPTDGSVDAADSDGDHFDNYSEWRARTNPTDATSYLRFLSVSVNPTNDWVGGPAIEFTWPNSPGVSYLLEQSTNPAGPYEIINEDIQVAQTNTIFLALPLSSGPVFYRVGVK